MIVSVIAVGYQPPKSTDSGTAVATATVQTPLVTPEVDKPSVDELVATNIAASLAQENNMAIANNIGEMSVSLSAKLDLAQTSDTAIVKPEIVQLAASNRDIITYVVQKGDTLASIAAKFNLKTQTIRWANDMANDKIAVGKKLVIPPVDGVIYTVKNGDTIEKLASTYGTSKNRIVSVNDLEFSGPKPGTKIVIPDGVLPTEQRPGYVAPQTTVATTPVFSGISGGGDGYAYGYCTYYAAARRAQMGKPIPGSWGNASSWAYFAARQGYSVGGTPRVGAIMQNGGGLGHVAIVEAVNPGVSITISEMNGYRFGGGWNRVGRGDISWGQATSGGYLYIY